MYYLITGSFYCEYELIRTDNREQAEQYIYSQGTLPNIEIIGSQDDLSFEEVKNYNPAVLFIDDYLD